MFKKDQSGDPHYLITGQTEFGEKWYKVVPYNVEIMTAHFETLQWIKERNKYGSDPKCKAV